MENPEFRKRWQRLFEGGARPEDLFGLAAEIARSFVTQHYQQERYDRGAIELLCEMATAFQDPALDAAAAGAFFGIVVESLCDDYEELQLGTYNRVMAQAISFCRRLPQAKPFDAMLRSFGLFSERQLIQRADLVHARGYRFDPGASPQRVVILSRVTIGADVAIVSVMLQRLAKRFPQADLVVLGSPKLAQIFGGNPRVRIRALSYARRGGLLERFETWFEIMKLLAEETPAAGPEAMLILDPDSRLAQLGMLPVSGRDNYFYFNSHGNGPGGDLSMAELTNAWLDSVLAEPGFCYPRVWIPEPFTLTAVRLTASLRQSGCRRITAVNFGVGGNSRKRLGISFEKHLISRLLQTPGTVILLDRGFGREELAGSRDILAAVASLGHPAREGRFADLSGLDMEHGVLGVESGIGEMAALIAQSDDYIGYDSACQHIAAALAVPTLTVFTGTDNPGFVRRWSACGNTACRIFHVSPTAYAHMAHPEEGVAGQLLALREEMKKGNGAP